jgi:DNA polymerase-3 subunit delta'
MYVNCEDKAATSGLDACGVCPTCRQFGKLAHPDLHFVLPVSTTDKITKSQEAVSASFYTEWRAFFQENPYPSLSDWAQRIGSGNKQCSISREESRNILKMVSLKAFGAEYKCVLIWLPEQMHTSAANALLKLLEEPPAKTLFLLVTEALDKILPTVLSRTQVIKVPPFSEDEIEKYLIASGVPEGKAQAAGKLAEGNMNLAFKLANDMQDNNLEWFKEWMRAVYVLEINKLIDGADDFATFPKDTQKNNLLHAMSMFREAMTAKFAGEERLNLTDDTRGFIIKFAGSFNAAALEGIYECLNEAIYHLERNANPKILFLDLSVQLRVLMRS